MSTRLTKVMHMGLKKIRKSSGLTQEDVASLLDISRTTISMWETGNNFPRIDVLLRLAELYGCTVDDLLKEDTETA